MMFVRIMNGMRRYLTGLIRMLKQHALQHCHPDLIGMLKQHDLQHCLPGGSNPTVLGSRF
jgi:hypothetical protein